MSVAISGRYAGALKVDLLHEPSGTAWRTAAPLDNQGDGSSFSPTDMAAAALGACMVTLIAIVGERQGLKLDGLAFRLEKEMQSSPRRIAKIAVRLEMPAGLGDKERSKLERAALTCPVHASLAPWIDRPVEFVYPD